MEIIAKKVTIGSSSYSVQINTRRNSALTTQITLTSVIMAHFAVLLILKMIVQLISFTITHMTMISSFFITKLNGVLTIWHTMIKLFVYMPIICKISEESPTYSIINPTLVQIGMLKNLFMIIKKDVQMARVASSVMDGRSSSFILRFTRPSLATHLTNARRTLIVPTSIIFPKEEKFQSDWIMAFLNLCPKTGLLRIPLKNLLLMNSRDQFCRIPLTCPPLDREYYWDVVDFEIKSADSIASSKNNLESNKHLHFTRGSRKRTTLLDKYPSFLLFLGQLQKNSQKEIVQGEIPLFISQRRRRTA